MVYLAHSFRGMEQGGLDWLLDPRERTGWSRLATRSAEWSTKEQDGYSTHRLEQHGLDWLLVPRIGASGNTMVHPGHLSGMLRLLGPEATRMARAHPGARSITDLSRCYWSTEGPGAGSRPPESPQEQRTEAPEAQGPGPGTGGPRGPGGLKRGG